MIMNYNSRKYKLIVKKLQTCGLITGGTVNICNITNPFTFSVNGTSCSYQKITTNELASLSRNDYCQRVVDYLNYLRIETISSKNKLIDESSFYNPEYDVTCKLNSDFTVYRFLSGVRVINVGTPVGIVEYKAYPLGDDENNYSWQKSKTFLNINLNETYIFKIRDVVNDTILCEYEKTILISSLVPSTTVALPPKTISIFNTGINNPASGVNYNQSKIISNPTLSEGQCVKVNYMGRAQAFGGGQSCVDIFCKGLGDNAYVKIDDVNETCSDDTIQGNFIIDSNTCACYNVVVQTPTCGSIGEACFKLTSVDGLNTTQPIICSDKNEIFISISKPPQDVDILLSCINSNSPTPGVYYENGLLDFSPSIPEGNCVCVDLSAVTMSCGSGAFGDICFICKKDGLTSFEKLCQINTNCDRIIPAIVCHGDQICYKLTVFADHPGTCATAKICIDSVNSSIGVNPTIAGNNLRCETIFTEPTPLTVSMCKTSDFSPVPEICAHYGFINGGSSLLTNQVLCVNYSALASIVGNNESCVVLGCKPKGNTTYTKIREINNLNSDGETTGTITIRKDDLICYHLYTYIPTLGQSTSCIRLTSVTGTGGVSPTINPNKCSDCASLSTV